jgi:dihydropyrimidinase
MDNILIKNGLVVNADKSFESDILVENGKISHIGKDLSAQSDNTRIVDASNRLVIPGGIDPHTHMELPVSGGMVSSDDFLSGSRAALAGATTSIIDFVTPSRGQSLIAAYEERLALTRKAVCNVFLHISIVSWDKTTADEVKECVKRGAVSFKVYLAYKETIGIDDATLIRAMDAVASAGGIIIAHCENGDAVSYLREKFIRDGKTAPKYHPLSRPPELEAEAINRIITLAKLTDCPIYIVHCSTADGLDLIRKARREGQTVYAEVCPHHLFFDKSRYDDIWERGADFMMSPPLRDKSDVEALWRGIEDSTVDTIATDHCPFMRKDRETGRNNFTLIPNGVGGVEHRVGLIYNYGVKTGRITPERFVALVSDNVSRIFSIYPRKGVIAVGSDADIAIINLSEVKTISVKDSLQNCDYNIYEGMTAAVCESIS